MMSFEQITAIIMVLYAASTLAGITGMMLRMRSIRVLAVGLALAGFGLQTVDMGLGVHSMQTGGLSGGIYLQLLAWFMVLCGSGGSAKLRSSLPLLFVIPLALILFLMSWRFLHFQISLPSSITGSFYALHVGSLYLSLALMALAFAASISFIYVEKMIKSKTPLTGFRQDFPALTILDKINATTSIMGFILFSVGIIFGFIWAEKAFKSAMLSDPKEIVSIVIWALYAWLLYMRTIKGLRGRKPAMLVIWIFALSVFSIFVINSFVDTHHSFTNLNKWQ